MLYGYNSFRLKRYWKTRFDISNYEVNIIHGRKQKRIELIKDGLSGENDERVYSIVTGYF